MSKQNRFADSSIERMEIMKEVKKLYLSSNIADEHLFLGDQLVLQDTYSQHFLHYALISKDKSLPYLVAIHGYGGGGYNFFKLPQYFIDTHQILLIDLPGMGLSSKHEFYSTFNTTEQWLYYFLACIEDFLSLFKILKICLVGHSLGSLISFHYFQKNPQQITKLIFLSPAGFNPPDENFHAERNAFLEKQNFIWKYLTIYLEKKVYEEKKNLFDFFYRPLRPFLVKKYLSNQRFGLAKQQVISIYKIVEYSVFDKNSSYQCLPYVLFVMKSPVPIRQDILNHFSRAKDFLILYGQNDWMDHQVTINFLKENKLNILYQFIWDGDHQLQYNNINDVQQAIKDFLNGTFVPTNIQPKRLSLMDHKPTF